MNGIIVVDKPVGVTSQVVIGRLRKVTGIRRIGHCGTLDPLASGVLPVMIGNATKACEYLMDHDKVYIASIKLGVVTDTEDITGEVLQTHEGALPSFEEFASVASTFVGEIKQIPPMYSALKKDGIKLVNLAREGIEVEREPRTVVIHSLETYEQDGVFCMRVHCSRGTYIRTLCADIGAALGCGGAMAALRRVEAGGFSLKQATVPAALEEMSEQERLALLLPVDALFADLPAVRLSAFHERLIRDGCAVDQRKVGQALELGAKMRLLNAAGEFFALGETVTDAESGALCVKSVKLFVLE